MMMFGRAFSQNGEMIQGDLRTIFSGQVSSQPIGRPGPSFRERARPAAAACPSASSFMALCGVVRHVWVRLRRQCG